MKGRRDGSRSGIGTTKVFKYILSRDVRAAVSRCSAASEMETERAKQDDEGSSGHMLCLRLHWCVT